MNAKSGPSSRYTEAVVQCHDVGQRLRSQISQVRELGFMLILYVGLNVSDVGRDDGLPRNYRQNRFLVLYVDPFPHNLTMLDLFSAN